MKRGVFCLLLLFSLSFISAADDPPVLTWTSLTPLPDPIGFAGAFAGVADGALLVAGGANFPDLPPWDKGKKEWYANIYVLPAPDSAWEKAPTQLPRPSAYGVSLTVPEGVLCIGGADAEKHYADVFLLKKGLGAISLDSLPSLPKPVAYACGAVVGSTVYIAGGRETPVSSQTLHTFYSLDLVKKDRWIELETWPGPPRMLATAGCQEGKFFLFGGTDLEPVSGGEPQRKYLRDAYAYVAADGWKRVADMPRPAVAAPSPSAALGQSHLAVIGGDTGEYVGQDLREKHPGFSNTVLLYHTITNTWSEREHIPSDPAKNVYPPVTCPAVDWKGSIVLASGEVKPGIRTPNLPVAKPVVSGSTFRFMDYFVLFAYLASQLLMGFYFATRGKSTDDFFMAGRRIPAWAAGVSIFGTQLSAITFMSVPAKAYATNWTYFLTGMGIIAVAPIVIYVYLPFYRRLNITSAYEYLEKRFNLPARILGSASYICMQLGRMAVVLFLPSIALSTVTGLPASHSILLMGAVTTVYTVLGGMEAVVWTDVVQVFVLAGGALVALASAVYRAGGVESALSIALGDGKMQTFLFSWDYTVPATWVVLLSYIGILIPYTADQTVVQRYMTTSTEKKAARGIWINGLLSIPSTFIFFGLGAALYCFYKTHPGSLDPNVKTDAILTSFVVREMPAGVAGLVVAGVFAASMSTLSAIMNSVATAFITDFLRRFRPETPDKTWLWCARVITFALGVMVTACAVIMATYDIASMWDQWNKIMGLFGAGLAGLFALGILTRRANGYGALVGMAVAAGCLWYIQGYTRIHFFAWSSIGIVLCVTIGYVVSLLIPARRKSLDGLTVYTMKQKE